jgi:hypothetical protein
MEDFFPFFVEFVTQKWPEDDPCRSGRREMAVGYFKNHLLFKQPKEKARRVHASC